MVGVVSTFISSRLGCAKSNSALAGVVVNKGAVAAPATPAFRNERRVSRGKFQAMFASLLIMPSGGVRNPPYATNMPALTDLIKINSKGVVGDCLINIINFGWFLCNATLVNHNILNINYLLTFVRQFCTLTNINLNETLITAFNR
jgi:hypothetical protein